MAVTDGFPFAENETRPEAAARLKGVGGDSVNVEEEDVALAVVSGSRLWTGLFP
jgi:hypothetical protein